MILHRDSARAQLSSIQLSDGLVQDSFIYVSLTLAGISGRLGSVGAVHQNDYMWPLQRVRLRVVGLTAWQLRAQRLVFRWTRQKLRGLLWLSLPGHKHHFHPTLLEETVQAGPDSRGGVVAPTTY